MSAPAALLAAALALDVTPSPSPTPEIDPSRVTPGYLGLFFFLALGVAVFFLWRSMNHQLKKITVPDDGVPVDGPGSDGPPPGSAPASSPGDRADEGAEDGGPAQAQSDDESRR